LNSYLNHFFAVCPYYLEAIKSFDTFATEINVSLFKIKAYENFSF